MKKTLTLLFAVLMVLALVACDDNEQNDDRSKKRNTTATTTVPTTAPTTAPTEDKELSLGVINGQNYENAFIGIGWNIPSDWNFKSEAEILRLNNLSMDMLEDDVAEALKNAPVIYDMVATNEDESNNIVVTIEKHSYLDVAITNIPAALENTYAVLEQSFINMGYSNLSHSISTMSIDGRVLDTMTITASLYGIPMTQTSVYYLVDNYFVSIGVTSLGIDSSSSLLNSLYFID